LIRLPQAHAELIKQAIAHAQAAGELPAFELPAVIPVTPTKKAGQGDYSTALAMSLAKSLNMKPQDVANVILKHLPPAPFVRDVAIAGAGFINFTLSEDFLKAQVEEVIAEGERLFTLELGAGKRAQVEFVSANPTGPITIGHTRNAVVGDAMARLLEAAGYAVQREYYFNNAGNQMYIMGLSLQARYLEQLGLPFSFPEEGYKGEYITDYAKQLVAEQGDALKDADWTAFKDYAEAQMFAWIKRTLARVEISHDAFFNEHTLFETNAVWDTLRDLRERGYIYEAKEWEGADEEKKRAAEARETATWFRTAQFGDDTDRVMVKGDGSPTYTLPDIAYHRDKFARNFDVLINVLGADHLHQAKVVAWGLTALGLPAERLHVIFIQMVKTMRNGQEFKISKRAGIFDTLDDLIDMTSADAIRYHMLARTPNTHLTFDVDKVVEQTNDNPVYYIQNAHVRCAGILREAEARGMTDDGADLTRLGEDELIFIRKVLELGDVIELCATTYEPHRIAFYAHELAGVFHPIYDRVRALHTEVDPQTAKARLRFYRAAGVVFKRVLRLMGMSAPERM
jgi:arginyl-tRNA synthetase